MIDAAGLTLTVLTIGCLIVCRLLARGGWETSPQRLSQVIGWTAATTALAAVTATVAVITDDIVRMGVFLLLAIMNAYLLGRMVQHRADQRRPHATSTASNPSAG